nr:DHA2 family efflux MFS transporter permease subunit [Thermoanaerobacterales bacterium]
MRSSYLPACQRGTGDPNPAGQAPRSLAHADPGSSVPPGVGIPATRGGFSRTVHSRALDQRLVVAVTFVAAAFMSLLDTTIVNVALPSLADDLGVGPGEIDRVVVGYLLSLAVFMPSSGWIGDRFGAKRTFLAAVTLFTAASALCGTAGSLEALVAFRVLQGVGGGLLVPVGMAMLFRAYPQAERARASRLLLVPTACAPAIGPILGGVLVDTAGWHWIFLVNVPIGVATVLFGAALLEDGTTRPVGRFDAAGFVLSGGGLALLLYALDQGASRGWGSPAVVVAGVAGLLALTALVAVELRTAEPMLDLRLLGNRLFRTVNAGMFAGFGAFLGVLYVMPLFLQDVRDLSPTGSGLVTFTEAIGVMVASQIGGRLYPRVGPRRLMTGGLLWTAAVMAAFATLSLETGVWQIRAGMFLLGLGMGFMIMSQQTAAFAQISPEDTADATAIFAMLRQTAAAVGVALLATVLTSALPDGGSAAPPGDQLGAYRLTFLVASALALVAALVLRRIDDRDAAATMARPGTGAAAPARR